MINVLYQSNDNYAPYMGVSIFSLLSNNSSNHINVYIIDDYISEQNKQKLQRLESKFDCSILFVDVHKIISNTDDVTDFEYSGFRKNKHSYYKMFIANLIPELTGRIIYIDCDTVVVGSLDRLTSFDMQEKTIGMVQDALVGKSKKCLGFNEEEPYFNSGVILIDVDKWRERKCFEVFVDHICKHTYGTVDQDALNIAFKNDIVQLPLNYNYQSVHMISTPKSYVRICGKRNASYYGINEIDDADRNTVIIHFLRFLGGHPWDQDSIHPAKTIYDYYLQMTEWKDFEKNALEISLMFRIERALYKVLPKGAFLWLFFVLHEKMIDRSNKKLKG